MRIQISSMQPSEIAKLSRSTRWRAKKRGWVALDYHVPRIQALSIDELSIYSRAETEIEQEIDWTIYRLMVQRGCPLPSYMDRDDLRQECRIVLLRSLNRWAKANYPRAYRLKIVSDRIREIVGRARGDADRMMQMELEAARAVQ